MNVDFVPGPPLESGPRGGMPKYCDQIERAVNAHIAQYGCRPKHATLYVATDRLSLDRIVFDDPECGV